MANKEYTFWDHIEVLRWMIFRCIIAVIVLMVGIFFFKDFLFDKIIFAPLDDSFITYKWLKGLVTPVGNSVEIININLAAQFITHMKVAALLGLIIAIPYILVELWLFIKPALYKAEQGIIVTGAFSFVILFLIGVVVSYLFIFPFTLAFLGNYSVSDTVTNQISLDSYIGTFLILIFTIGLIFEMPVLAYFLAKIGILDHSFMRQNRKYAIVIIMVLSALITPSGDAFTMLIVALPICLLWELSAIVVKFTTKKHIPDEND